MKTLLLIVVVAALLRPYQQSALEDENEGSGSDTINDDENSVEHTVSENDENVASGADEGSKEFEGSGSDENSDGEGDTEDQDSGSEVDNEDKSSTPNSEEDDNTEEDEDSEENEDGDTSETSEEDDSTQEDGNSEENKSHVSGSDSSKDSAEDSGSDQSSDSKGNSPEERPEHNHDECKHECWTAWFNRDDPSASGDWETLENLYHEFPGMICKRPLRIEAKTACGRSVASTGDVISVSDVRNGFICKNSEQPLRSQCRDYKVRFLCPREFCHPKVCWTRWFNRDNPNGIGDWELLCELRAENPGKICERPLHIEFQSKLNDVPAVFTGHTFHSPTEGCGRSKCDHRERRSQKVRFGCPCDV